MEKGRAIAEDRCASQEAPPALAEACKTFCKHQHAFRYCQLCAFGAFLSGPIGRPFSKGLLSDARVTNCFKPQHKTLSLITPQEEPVSDYHTNAYDWAVIRMGIVVQRGLVIGSR